MCLLLAGHTWKCSAPNVTEISKSSLALSLSCPFGEASNLSACHVANYSVMFRPQLSGKDFVVRTSKAATFRLDRLIPFTSYEIKVKAMYSHLHCNSSSIPPSSSIHSTTLPASETDTCVNRTRLLINLCSQSLSELYIFILNRSRATEKRSN